MPIVDPNADFLAGVPEVFTSPFPSSPDSLGKLRQLTGDAGNYSAAQARSWQDVTQMAMRAIATSSTVGGIRQVMMPKLVEIDAGIAGDVVSGIFGRAEWPDSTDPQQLGLAAARVGLNVALDLVSAVPVWGGIAKAAVAIGKMMWALARRSEPEQELIVPWAEFSGQGDEDSVKVLLSSIAPSVDWTPFYTPPLNPRAGWKLAKTKKGGDTRSWGPFSGSGSLEYEGYGMMPNTQRMVDVIQLAPLGSGPGWVRDAVTNVGDFYPAMAQFGTASWQWANKLDGIGMYAIKPAELIGLWREFWDSFFADGFDALDKTDRTSLEGRYIAKALLKQIVLEFADGSLEIGMPGEWLTTAGGNIGTFITPAIWNKNPLGPQKLSTPFESIIGPALERMQRRQLYALKRSLACAYVRPEPVDGLPAHAAFLDRGPALDPKYASWGEQLTAKCLQVREILLTVDALWDVNMIDAENADPKFAARMREKRGHVGSVRLTAGAAGLDHATARVPPAKPPQGGAPFDGVIGGAGRRRRKPGMSTAAKAAIAGAAVGVGYLAVR